MKNKMIFGLFVALLLLMVSVGAWAQQVPGVPIHPDNPTTAISGFASPQSNATQGRFRSAADDFIRPDSYAGLKLNNWFGLVSFADNTKATLGYAGNFGAIYLGAFYTGNFWTGTPSNNYVEQKLTLPGGKDKDIRLYGTAPSVTGTNIGTFAVLLGVADMGFRLAYTSHLYNSFKSTDNIGVGPSVDYDPADPTDTRKKPTASYKSYEEEKGFISPQIAWSMAKDLTPVGLKPWATVDLSFYRNYLKHEKYNDTANDGTTEGEKIGNSQNYFNPVLNLGLGGITFYNRNGFKGAVDLDYQLGLKLYDNEYSYTDTNSKSKIKNVSGINNNGAMSTDFFIANQFVPSVSGSWSGGNLALKAKLNLQLDISNTENAIMGFKQKDDGAGNQVPDGSGSLVQNGKETKMGEFGFSPNLRLGAQWKAVPGKLTLNAGGRINISGIKVTTTESATYANGVKEKNSDEKDVKTSYVSTATTLTLGPTFTPTENLTFEASCGVANNTLNVFESTTGGMFMFGSILVSLKF